MDVRDYLVRIVTLYMLPSVAILTKDRVAVVVIVPTYAFDGRVVLDVRWPRGCEIAVGNRRFGRQRESWSERLLCILYRRR